MTTISATPRATTAASIGKGGLLTVAGDKVSATPANTRRGRWAGRSARRAVRDA